MSAPDPRNVRDMLLEAGYSPVEVERMLHADSLVSILTRAVRACDGMDCPHCFSRQTDDPMSDCCPECSWFSTGAHLLKFMGPVE